MEQNNIWMRFLQLGVIISILFFSNSCKKDNFHEKYPEFYLINETNHLITFDDFPNNYSIQPKSFIKIVENQSVAGDLNNANNYQSPYLTPNKSLVTIRFNNAKCLLNQMKDNEHSIVNIASFVAEKTSKYDYKFTYTFTEADYNRAVTCP